MIALVDEVEAAQDGLEGGARARARFAGDDGYRRVGPAELLPVADRADVDVPDPRHREVGDLVRGVDDDRDAVPGDDEGLERRRVGGQLDEVGHADLRRAVEGGADADRRAPALDRDVDLGMSGVVVVGQLLGEGLEGGGARERHEPALPSQAAREEAAESRRRGARGRGCAGVHRAHQVVTL